MSNAHLVVYFVLCIAQTVYRIKKDWAVIEFHNRQSTENYIINRLLFPIFTNVGLIFYGLLLLSFILHPPIFYIFADDLLELSQYLGLLALYMIYKGTFSLVHDNGWVKKDA